MAGHDHTPEIHEHADAWHHHTPAEGRPQHEHASIVDSGLMLKWFVGMSALLVIVIIALGMYFHRYNTLMRERYVENQELAKPAMIAIAEAEARLGTDGKPFAYTPVDKVNRRVQLPIDEGIRRAVARYAGNGASQPAPPATQPAPATQTPTTPVVPRTPGEPVQQPNPR